MVRRAGKGLSRKRKLIKKINEAIARDTQAKIRREQKRANLPQIKEITVFPPPGSANTRTSGSDSSDHDVLRIHPEELSERWSPDDFDREYFRLWERETEREKREDERERREKERGRREAEKERREIEREKREKERERREVEREERERRERERELEKERREIERERRESERERRESEKKREEEGIELMTISDSDDDIIMLEDFPPIEKEERAFEAIMSRMRQEKRETEASRAIVPNNIRNHWLKTKSRLNLSLPFI